MTQIPEPYTPTHVWVAAQLKYSVSGVSLLRTGHRRPTLRTMEAVQEAFGWNIEDQVKVRHDYPAQLNRVLAEAYQKYLNETHSEECTHHDHR